MKNTPSLEHIQQSFANAIYVGNNALITDFLKTDGPTPNARMQIYHDNVYMVLTNTLKNVYPGVCALVGERFFRYAAHEYIKQHPSISGNLDDYGNQLPSFLQNFEPVKNLPYLPDIATFEWLRHLAYLADDHLPIDATALSQTKEDDYSALSFTLHPSANLFSSDYPIEAIWNFTQESNTNNKQPPNLENSPSKLLVWRPELKIEHLELSNDEYYFLKNIQLQKTLSETFAIINNTSFEVSTNVIKFVKNGTFVDFECKEPPTN